MGQICLTTYDKKVHQSISLNFTLQSLDSIEGIIHLFITPTSIVHDNHYNINMHTQVVYYLSKISLCSILQVQLDVPLSQKEHVTVILR